MTLWSYIAIIQLPLRLVGSIKINSPVFPSQGSSIFAIQDVAFGRIAKRPAGRLVEMNDVVYRSIHKRAEVRFKTPRDVFKFFFFDF